MRLRVIKSILWFLAGSGLTVIILRIIHGPGSVVALTDILPWGLWKGGGVVALVPIGGAGFTLAAFVYIFHWDRYKPLARGAVLLGLMCYSSVAIGLTFDIGIWWRIVYPLVFWQFHSTLFEIAWCIMLYLGVLVVEFSHAVLERLNFPRLLAASKKVSIVFVIAGIALSTLHQSSLGTLFLATPYRLHPLWHTDLLPFLFLITAVGLGCLTISWVALLVHWLYKAEPPMDSISGLGRISSWVLGFYLLLRFGEIFLAGEGSLLFAQDWNIANFWLEILISGLVPVVLLSMRRFRSNPTAMFWISTFAIVGMSLNRVNVAGLATLSATGSTYLPIWPEWATTIGILSGAGIVFLFCIENFKVFESIGTDVVRDAYASPPVDHADWKTLFFRNPLSNVRTYSMMFVLACGLTLGFLPDSSVFGVEPEKTPVQGNRVVEIKKTREPGHPGTTFAIATKKDSMQGQALVDVFLIDANRNSDYVLFDHKMHITRSGDSASCKLCHHMNKPLDKATSCHECHSDMYLTVDIFDHALHSEKLGGNAGCKKCHTDPNAVKTRENTTACSECHPDMRNPGSLVRIDDPAKRNKAPGYMDAMHSLCITCHEKNKNRLEVPNENLARCTTCHRDLPGLKELALAPRP